MTEADPSDTSEMTTAPAGMTATLLFGDITAFTALTEAHGGEESASSSQFAWSDGRNGGGTTLHAHLAPAE